jgi:hypothetical protein
MGLERTHEVTIEGLITAGGQRSDGSILKLGAAGARREIELSQRDGSYWFSIRAKRQRSDSWSPEARLFEVDPGKSVHLVVTYRPGELRAYRNGALVAETDAMQGDFFRWEKGQLVLGENWRGTVEGLAVYSRILAASEVGENAARYTSLIAEREPVERVVVEATRTRASSRPRLSEISPYREALVVNEYRIDRVVSGTLAAPRVRVAEWAVLGGEAQSAQEGRVRLVLERFGDNPQLEGTVLRDELDGGDDVLYYAVP